MIKQTLNMLVWSKRYECDMYFLCIKCDIICVVLGRTDVISQGLVKSRSRDIGCLMMISLWNLTGISAALLPRSLSNFRAIGKVQTRISQHDTPTPSLWRLCHVQCGDVSVAIWKTVFRRVFLSLSLLSLPMSTVYLSIVLSDIWNFSLKWINQHRRLLSLS